MRDDAGFPSASIRSTIEVTGEITDVLDGQRRLGKDRGLDDEFEVEITPLRRSVRSTAGGTSGLNAARTSLPFAPRLTTRARFLRAGMLVIVIAVAAAVLVARLPESLGAGILPPDSQQLDPAHMFTWAHSVPWGVLSVDGGTRSINTYAPGGAPGTSPVTPRPFALAPGRHILEYIAPPFPTRTCTVDVPSKGADTCTETSDGDDGMRELELGATPEALPPAAYRALQAAVQAAFNISQAEFTLDPGARFLALNGQVVTADEKLTLQPRYFLSQAPTGAHPGDDRQCLSICDAGANSGFGSPWWTVLAETQVVFDYRRATGKPLYIGAPAAPVASEANVLLPLGVAWSGGQWGLRPTGARPGTTSPFCLIANMMRSQLLASASQATGSIDWSSATDVPLFRCLLAGDEGAPLRPASPDKRKALLLYQSGLLLAASPAAHQAYPQLPVANEVEQRLADKYAPAG